MRHRRIAFAIPGDISTVSGGYIYDRSLMESLRDLGHEVAHIELPASFPNPTASDCAVSVERLGVDVPLIIDGLAFGALPTAIVAQIEAPLIALIHHPLAKESGLSDARRDDLYQTERDNLALAHHVLVPSPHTAAILMSEYDVAADKVTIVRPGTLRPVGQSSKADPALVLSVGILAPRKGHDILLKALAQITDVAWRCVIVGPEHDIDHAGQLVAMRDELGLSDRVDFTGQVSDERLADLYQQATVFALATRYEGYGIVFDEAQAHGLPIVSCAAGAVPDTVPPETGILVPPDAPDAFAAALRGLILDETLRDTLTRGAQRASLSFPSWKDAAQTVSDAIRDALKVEGWDVD